MKSIKPGRGPSMMGGMGSVILVVFGIFWTILAANMTAGIGLVGVIFPLFGVCFVAMGVVNAVYSFKNATGENRYSEFDIVDEEEERDPLNERFGAAREKEPEARPAGGFCPYCGAPVEGEYVYCRKCGRELPK